MSIPAIRSQTKSLQISLDLESNPLTFVSASDVFKRPSQQIAWWSQFIPIFYMQYSHLGWQHHQFLITISISVDINVDGQRTKFYNTSPQCHVAPGLGVPSAELQLRLPGPKCPKLCASVMNDSWGSPKERWEFQEKNMGFTKTNWDLSQQQWDIFGEIETANIRYMVCLKRGDYCSYIPTQVQFWMGKIILSTVKTGGSPIFRQRRIWVLGKTHTWQVKFALIFSKPAIFHPLLVILLTYHHVAIFRE